MELSDDEMNYLHRSVDLAREALEDGDEPFGCVLVDGRGEVRYTDRNRIKGGDRTQHPELAAVRWAVANLSESERAAATVYTSGEHCPMCAAAHAWAGLGPIVYATGSAQLAGWLETWEIAPPPVAMLPITAVAPGVDASGPVDELAEDVKDLHRRYHGM